MDVIVKGSPSIEISFENKVIKVEGGGGPSDSPFEKGDAENSAILKGGDNKATGVNSLSIGRGSKAEGECAAAFGNSVASGDFSHSEGGVSSSGSGRYTKAIGRASHAEGEGCHASSNGAHAEGIDTDAKMKGTHAEGYQTQANAQYSHAEGVQTIAEGNASHAEGKGTVTTNIAEHAQGQYNVSTPDFTIHSVGIGASSGNKRNAHEITRHGKSYFLNIGGYDGTNPTESEDLAIVVNNKVDKVEGKGLSTNDYTDEDKEKLSSIEEGAQKNVAPDWNANLGETGYIQNRPFRIIDSASGNEYKFDTPLKEVDFTCVLQENEYGDIESARWEKIIAYSSVSIMGVFANGYYDAGWRASYKGAIRPLGPLYCQSYHYEESDDRKYNIYIENIIEDYEDYYEEYSKLIVENISSSGMDFPKADVYVLIDVDNPVHIDAIDENYLPNTIARQEAVDEVRDETVALWENVQTHDEKLNEVEAKIGSEVWSGVYIIKINSKTIGTNTSYPQITTIFNDLKSLLADNRYPSVILIDEGVDVPNMSVVESIYETESTVTCIQIRPQVSSASLLLMGYSFSSNGKLAVNSNSISSGVRALDPIELGNSITNPTVDGAGVDITTHYSSLLSAANTVYNNMGRASFSIKFNYRVMTCIGVKTKESNTILVAWFTDVDNATHYLITLNKSMQTATLSAKSI